MNGRLLVMLVGVAALFACASVVAFTACGGDDGNGKPETTSTSGATPTPGPEQVREMAAIPDLSCEDCASKADVASDEKLSGSEAMDAIEASKEASDIYSLAGDLGYGDVLQGLKTTYTDGTVVHSALIRGETKGAAILATSTGATAGSVLIRLDPDNPDRLIVTDGKGSATVTWAGDLVDSQETHSSCHYWHCVGSAISWLYTDSWYADLLGGCCRQCAEELDEYWCALCIAAAPSGLLAGVADCGIDDCDFCKNDSCGDDVVTGRSCYRDPASYGTGLTPIYAVYDTVDDYYCQNPGEGISQCMVSYGTARKVQVCPGDCAADGESCAPAQLRTCDPQACAGQTEMYTTGSCSSRRLGPQIRWEVEWTGRIWSCQPDGAGGSVCAPGLEGTFYRRCNYGCNADRTACAPGPTPTPTTSCQPADCERPDQPLGDARCILRPDDQKWIMERDYSHQACDPVQGGPGATCQETTITKMDQMCPAGCAADRKSCAPVCDPSTCNREEPGTEPFCVETPYGWEVQQIFDIYSCRPVTLGGSTCDYTTESRTLANCHYGCAADGKSCAAEGAVPAAPTDFIALQHAGGTRFEWHDHSNNEDGFHIYFGAKSLGRPSTLIATAAPNTSSIDTDFVRSGEEICWEIYAFNSAGESAPGHYCLPP